MRWLMRRLRAGEREGGAVAVLVSVLFAGGVVLGMGALVVDTGGYYAEAAQLQNGADAAARAVADACGQRIATCAANLTPSGLAGTYANKNANDGTSKVDSVCLSAAVTGVSLPICPASTPGCTTSTSTASYVQVVVSTLQTNGSTVLPPTFGKAVLGSSYQGGHIVACARAVVDEAPAGGGNLFPMTVSYCDWQFDTAFGVTYAPPLIPISTTNLTPASEHVLTVHGQQLASFLKLSCNVLNLGDTQAWNVPGAYGWIGDGQNCTASVTTSTYAPAPGDPQTVAACATTLLNARASGDPLTIPVYSGTAGYGSNVKYTLQGLASFVVTGWDMTAAGTAWTGKTTVPANEPSIVNGISDYCGFPWVTGGLLGGLTGGLLGTPPSTCVFGYFTRAQIPPSALPFGIGNLLGGYDVHLIP